MSRHFMKNMIRSIPVIISFLLILCFLLLYIPLYNSHNEINLRYLNLIEHTLDTFEDREGREQALADRVTELEERINDLAHNIRDNNWSASFLLQEWEQFRNEFEQD